MNTISEGTHLFLPPNRYVFAGAEVYDDMDREDEEDEDDKSTSSEESSLSSLAEVPAISPPSTDEEGRKEGHGEGTSQRAGAGDGASHQITEKTPDVIQGQFHKELNGNTVDTKCKSELDAAIKALANGTASEASDNSESVDTSNIPDVIPIINVPVAPKNVQD